MAEKEEEKVDAASESVRAGLLKLGKNAALLLALAALIAVVWVMVFRSDPRAAQGTIEETIDAYNETIRPYTITRQMLPNPTDVDYFLTFFDSGSRAFFRANFEEMARRRVALTPERFDALGRDGRRGEAMLFLLDYPPLSGIITIDQRRPTEDGAEEVVVRDRENRPRRVTFRRTGGRWEMDAFAGALPALREQLGLAE